MDPIAAKFIATGLACVGMGLSAVGLGVLFVATSPEQTKRTGLILISGFGAACLVLALLLLFAL
jgi:F-type H+-transporting ATPase subunit c